MIPLKFFRVKTAFKAVGLAFAASTVLVFHGAPAQGAADAFPAVAAEQASVPQTPATPTLDLTQVVVAAMVLSFGYAVLKKF